MVCPISWKDFIAYNVNERITISEKHISICKKVIVDHINTVLHECIEVLSKTMKILGEDRQPPGWELNVSFEQYPKVHTILCIMLKYFYVWWSGVFTLLKKKLLALDSGKGAKEIISYFLAKYKHVKFIEILYRSKCIKAMNVERDLRGIVFSISHRYLLSPLDSNTLAEYFKHKFISESLM